VSPGIVFLASEGAPTRTILCAGAGSFETAHVSLTLGKFLGEGDEVPEDIAASWPDIVNREDELVPAGGFEQSRHELLNAGHVESSGDKQNA
jgi:hypothetical protein